MNRNYELPNVDTNWYVTRNTHPAVATAIHAIAGRDRTPEQIWEEPTAEEDSNVVMAVAEYIRHGDFEAESDGRYRWGQSEVVLQS